MTGVEQQRAYRINAPQWYADEAFRIWLNGHLRSVLPGGSPATWHKYGMPNEYSDIFTVLDMSSEYPEGSDSDMPEHIFEELWHMCRKADPWFHGTAVVWISNLA